MPLKAFQLLSIEVNENIAFYIDADKDFANFNAICRQTRIAIQSHRCGAWRARWAQKYDMAAGRNGQMLKIEYMKRRMYLCNNGFNKGGHDAPEMNCIEALKQLIIESFAGPSKEFSRNLYQLKRYITKSNILGALDACVDPEAKTTRRLQTLLICLAHSILSTPRRPVHGVTIFMPLVQIMVYRKFRNFPLFQDNGGLAGSVVNTKFVLGMLYYWRYHILHNPHGPLVHIWDEVLEEDQPRIWKRPICGTKDKVRPLSTKWWGIHGFCPDSDSMDEVFEDMEHLDPLNIPFERFFMDEFDQRGVRLTELDFTTAIDFGPLPESIEQVLKAMPSEPLCTHVREVTRNGKDKRKASVSSSRPKKVAQTDIRRFLKNHSPETILKSTTPESSLPTSELNNQDPRAKVPHTATQQSLPQKGRDFVPFTGSMHNPCSTGVRGILHDLPSQSGIPGFQRMTFVSYDRRSHGPEDLESLDEEEEYTLNEGVVLPGGHMIIGRWWTHQNWYDQQPQESGPFIMWEVDQETEEWW